MSNKNKAAILNNKKILARIAEIIGAKDDSDIMKWFGTTSRSSVANWRGGTTIPIEGIIRLAEKFDLTLDYIILGKEMDQFTMDKINHWKQKYMELQEENAELYKKYTGLLESIATPPTAKSEELKKKR